MTGGAATAADADIVGIVAATPDLSDLATALAAAGLDELLHGSGPFTLFAPTNAAFAKLPPGTLGQMMQPENRAQLVALLQNHILSRRVTYLSLIESTQDLPTIGPRMLRTEGKMVVTVNGARIQQPALNASNGLIHQIDTVLLPGA